MDALAPRYDTRAPAQPTIWLSGGIVTFINKIGAVVWLAAVAGVVSAVLFRTGRISVAPVFYPIVAFAIAAAIFMFWLSAHVQRVGYAGRDLIVSNYSRQERIPFEQVEAVEPVWWNYRRMVRIRLRSDSSFGQVVYYIPKWAAFKCLWAAPENELRERLAASSELPDTDPFSTRA